MAQFISSNGTFYDDVWTQALDDSFLDELDFNACLERRALTMNDHEILTKVCDFLNKYSKTTLKYYDIYTRFQLAHRRYVTWDWIINFNEVQYNPQTFSVTATEETWEYICKLHELGGAYKNEPSEYMWYELEAIFGPNSARSSDSHPRRLSKPKRPMKDTHPDGTKKLTLDEVLQLTVEYERDSERIDIKDKSVPTPHASLLPPDRMSSTKGPGRIIPYPGHRIMSVEYNQVRTTTRAEGKGSTSTVKRFLDF